MRPAGMSSEHTHVLSMQNGSWPFGHSPGRSPTPSRTTCPACLPQLQPGHERHQRPPTPTPRAPTVRQRARLDAHERSRARRPRGRTARSRRCRTAARPPAPGRAARSGTRNPTPPAWPWNGATSAIVWLPSSSFANTASSPLSSRACVESRAIELRGARRHPRRSSGSSSPGRPNATSTSCAADDVPHRDRDSSSPSHFALSAKIFGPTESIDDRRLDHVDTVR